MSAGPTAGSPAPTGAGPVRRITLQIVIAEPDPEPGFAAASLETEVAGSVLAVLRDNGYAVESLEPVAADPSAGWPMWARQLDALLTEVATAERAATVAHAEAYLAAEGTQQYRAASADLAAAAAVEAHAKLAGRAEAFRMVLAGQAGRDALTAAPWGDAPRCVYWWHDPANRVRRCELYPGHDGAHRDGNSYADRPGNPATDV